MIDLIQELKKEQDTSYVGGIAGKKTI